MVTEEQRKLFEDNALRLVNSFTARNKNAVPLFGSYEDMIQELLLKVWTKMPLYDCSRAKLSTFIYYICSTCIKIKLRPLRSGKCRNDDISITEPIYEDLTLEDTLGDNGEFVAYMESRMFSDELKPLLCPELKLSVFGGLKQRDIALIVGRSQSIVARRIKKNINQLKYYLQTGLPPKYQRKRQQGGKKVEDECKRLGISVRTYYRRLKIKREKESDSGQK